MSADSRVSPVSSRGILPVRQGRRSSPCVFHALDDEVALRAACLPETRGRTTQLAFQQLWLCDQGYICALTLADKP
jgi:hypothetical protein